MNQIEPSAILPAAATVHASRGRRMCHAAAFLVVWIALGFALHLGANAYLVVGVPLAIAFQLVVARRPVAQAWVRSGLPFHLDAKGVCAALLLAIAPATMGIYGLSLHQWSVALWGMAGSAGAFGAVYAGRTIARGQASGLILGTLAAAAPGLAIMAGFTLRGPSPCHNSLAIVLLTFVYSFTQYVPVCFAMEEVVFRGVLDAYVAGPEDGARWSWITAAFLSIAWGLWHLPMFPAAETTFGALAYTAGKLVLVHLPIGLALTAAWRRSGGLLVPALAHALIDAFRNAMM